MMVILPEAYWPKACVTSNWDSVVVSNEWMTKAWLPAVKFTTAPKPSFGCLAI